MTVPAKASDRSDILESVLLKGDLAKLTAQERTAFYLEVCQSLGLNPRTKPFEYITLNGKLTLYALRACTDQLRKINNVTLEIVSRDVADDILTVHVRAKMPDGRTDEDLGAVHFPPTLKGEARVNAELKAVTKAKRRVTLSICGLGWLDETEVADIPESARRGNGAFRAPEPEKIAAAPPVIDREAATTLGVQAMAGPPVIYHEDEEASKDKLWQSLSAAAAQGYDAFVAAYNGAFGNKGWAPKGDDYRNPFRQQRENWLAIAPEACVRRGET